MDKGITSKYIKQFVCEKCTFKCCKRGDYNRHLMTPKHKRITVDNGITSITSDTEKRYACECGKRYLFSSGLSKHKKNCDYDSCKNIVTDTQPHWIGSFESELVSLLKDNREFQKQMLELIPKIQPSALSSVSSQPTVNNNTNVNNHIFNINVFLNEQCKDAVNLSEFIKSIEITSHDMEMIGSEGQTDGISKLLINKLKDIDLFKRPIHCSDLRKQIIYVKDNDKWEEEGTERPKLKYALDMIIKKSAAKIAKLADILDPDELTKTAFEICSDPQEDKIISKVLRGIVLNKKCLNH